MTPAEWYGSLEFQRVHQELAEQRRARDVAKLAARTPAQVERDRRAVEAQERETCAKCFLSIGDNGHADDHMFVASGRDS